MAILTREQFYYFVSDNFNLYYYPLIDYGNRMLSAKGIIEIGTYYEKKLIDQSLTHQIFDDYMFKFKKIYTSLKDTRQV